MSNPATQNATAAEQQRHGHFHDAANRNPRRDRARASSATPSREVRRVNRFAERITHHEQQHRYAQIQRPEVYRFAPGEQQRGRR